MQHIVKKVSALVAAVLVMLFPTTAFAQSSVTYDGGAKDFIFAPGSKDSPTDLFSGFKNVMPGDKLTEKITVKNAASNQVKVKIYLRSLGAEKSSEKFLSQLKLRVSNSGSPETAYMFDAAADQSDGLTDWVCLGMLYSGGEVDLNVALDVPVTMDNDFKESIGYLKWQFKVEEFPVESGDPRPPVTGDSSRYLLYVVFGVITALSLMLTVFLKRMKPVKKSK